MLFAASDLNSFVAGVSMRAPLLLVSVAVFELAGAVAGCVAGSAGVSVDVSALVPCRTETLPLRAGIEIRSADSMKTVAAAIVSFESTEAVPRGPNAALDTLLVNSAPASVLPGCSSTAATSTRHEIKNKPYKK